MADIFSKDKRSQIMSKVSGKENKPEILIRKFLFSKGFRFRKNDKRLAGKPDIVLPKYKTVIFVHGCFWHQHKDCRKAARPTSNTEFWDVKLDKNIERDKENIRRLKKANWAVIIIWECELKSVEKIEKLKKKLICESGVESFWY